MRRWTKSLKYPCPSNITTKNDNRRTPDRGVELTNETTEEKKDRNE